MQALEEATEVLGRANKDSVISDLKSHGIILSDEAHYSLNQIRDGLRSIFGEDATILLMERLVKALK